VLSLTRLRRRARSVSDAVIQFRTEKVSEFSVQSQGTNESLWCKSPCPPDLMEEGDDQAKPLSYERPGGREGP
jgi:hypothetical protein